MSFMGRTARPDAPAGSHGSLGGADRYSGSLAGLVRTYKTVVEHKWKVSAGEGVLHSDALAGQLSKVTRSFKKTQ